MTTGTLASGHPAAENAARGGPPGDAAELLHALGALQLALAGDPRLSSYTVSRPHPLLVQVRAEANSALIVPAPVWDAARDLLAPWTSRVAGGTARLLLLGEPEDPELHRAVTHGVAALLPARPSTDALAIALAQAFESMELRERSESRGKWLSRYRYELGELIEIARAITTKREIHELLTVILEKSRFVTAADAGSVYVVEPCEEGGKNPLLRFKLSQNESMPFDSREFTIPLTRRSMAGYCALERRTVNIEDVYELPPDSPFGFDRSFDDRMGYRTRSVLATPLVSSKGEVIGVLQLLNRKRDPKARLTQPVHFAEQVVPFDQRSEQLLETLAAQAGIALENALLYDEIRGLFEGFVRASVDAIEARDPTTSGHSRRVAELTVGLAHAVERVTTGPYAEVRFAREDIRELQYASLLHDFGKIGVREHVLVKAKKLYPHQLDTIRLRLDFVIRTLERDRLARRIHAMERHATPADLEALDRDFEARRRELDTAWTSIIQANEPTVLAAGDFQRITELASLTYTNPAGDTVALLGPDEVKALSIPRGSLTGEELDEIRSHVTHTHRFLSQIPWGKSFSRVPIIAASHHERVNGTGYPARLRAEEIPIQSKLMSISDIFDALTASDRPYKRAVPVEKALDILGFEVRDGHLDPELVRIFLEARPWEQVMGALY